MSSGSATSTQTSGLGQEFAPYLQQYGNFAAGVASNPYQQYNGPRVADLDPLQSQALGGYSDILSTAPSLYGAAGSMLGDTLSGAGGNPFLDQVEGKVTRNVTDAYNRATAGTRTNFNSAGGIGSARSGLAQDRNDTNLATGLTEGIGSLRAGAYESERNRQMQAASAVPGLTSGATGLLGNALQAGEVGRNQQQSIISTLYNDWTAANQYPEHQLGILSGALGPLFGAAPRQTTTTGPGSDPVAQGVGLMSLANYFGKSGK